MSAPDERQHPPGNGKEGALLSPSVQSIQQPLQQQHEDYDWMGVLDSLDDHFDLVEHDRLVYQQYHQYHYQPPHANGNGNVAPGSEDAASSPASLGGGTVQDQNPLVVVGDQHRNQHENHSHDRWDPSSSPSTTAGVGSGEGSNCDGVAALMVASAIAAAAAAAASCGGSEGEVESISMSGGGGATALAVADTAEMDDKKQSRVERKRTREKKRRFDTNSQFTALAELVKEIEATDLAEEALFDFNKRYENHDGQEEDDEQQQRQQQHDIGDGSIKTNCSDSTDNQHRCKRLDGNDLSFAPEERQSKMIKSTDVHDNSDNNNMTSSSLLPPTAGTTKSPTLLSSTSSMSSSTATSNRIDLIARTIVQLNQFRMLRRRRNNELRDCQRKNCELRKECEGLHRLVAQYKAMGKMGGDGGYTRPQVQEKVMMMVPMMVPQDAVSQIAAGYPAAHQHQVASASFAPATTMISHHPFFTNMATPHPWMGSGGGGTMMSSSASYQPHHSTTSVGGPGMQFVQQQQQQHLQHPSLPPSSQLYLHNPPAASAVGLTNLQPSGGLHSMTSGIASEATLSSNPHPHGILDNGTGGSELTVVQGVPRAGQTQSPHASATAQIGLQQHPLPDARGTVANHTFNTSSQSSHVTPAGVPFGMHPQHFHHAIISTTPHNNAMMPSHTAAPYNPSQGHDTLSTMIMNHPNQHSLPNPTAEVGAPNNNNLSYSSFAVNDSSATPAHHQQQLLQQQPSTQHHRDEAEKPLVQDTTTHHGGGGNLAHCA